MPAAMANTGKRIILRDDGYHRSVTPAVLGRDERRLQASGRLLQLISLVSNV